MCGIFFYRDPKGVNQDPRFDRALQLMLERGPDHQRLEYGQDFVVGHTRLSIIDLNPASNQPFWDRDHRYVITFNGEIYNYEEMRNILLAAGRPLRTQSDTEVLLESILCFGLEDTLRQIRGMFAFVLHDTRTQRTTIVRDHFGQKPLYYCQQGQTIAVASSIQSLLALQPTSNPDMGSYRVYLSSFGAHGTRGTFRPERTFFDGIRMLPAGHCLTYENESINLHEYFTVWSLYNKDEHQAAAEMSQDSCLARLKELTIQAVRRHLVSDVPVGILFSGGIDSALLYWYAQFLNPDITAFTKLSPGIEEIPLTVIPEVLSRRPANIYFGVQSPNNYLDGLVEFIAYSGAPSRWGSGPPMSRLCRDARRNGVYVLLSGDCADEYFGGYEHYRTLLSAPDTDIMALGDLVSLDERSPFYDLEQGGAYQSRQRGIRRQILERLEGIQGTTEKGIHATLLHDTASFLQTCNLPHSDAYSMSASVELRNPWLDMDLVRFVVNLPIRHRIGVHRSGFFGKRLLRELAAQEIGEFVNRKKEGTRNYSMRWADTSLWKIRNFSILDMIPFPDQLSKRDVIRLVNLEIFHQLFFLKATDFLPALLSERGIDKTVVPVERFA